MSLPTLSSLRKTLVLSVGSRFFSFLFNIRRLNFVRKVKTGLFSLSSLTFFQNNNFIKNVFVLDLSLFSVSLFPPITLRKKNLQLKMLIYVPACYRCWTASYWSTDVIPPFLRLVIYCNWRDSDDAHSDFISTSNRLLSNCSRFSQLVLRKTYLEKTRMFFFSFWILYSVFCAKFLQDWNFRVQKKLSDVCE